MTRLPSRAALLLAAALAAAACASAPPSDPKAPKPLDPKALAEAASLFDRAAALRERGEWDDAKDLFQEVHEDYPASPLAEEAQFQAAECAYGGERFRAAGELFGKFLEDRPLSARVGLAEKRMYDIGDYLVEDGRGGLWGTGIFGSTGEGVGVLRKLATLRPTSPWADDALLRIGRVYAEERDFAGAEAVLDELLKSHPYSEWRLEARFLLAWTFRRDNRGPEYDGEALRRARAHFRTYVEQASADPDAEKEYEDRIRAAREEIEAIDADLARKALARARLYRRMGRPQAALAVLQEAARQWGATEPGKECAAQAAELAAELGVAPPGAAPAPPSEGAGR